MASPPAKIPKLSELPLDKGDPHHSAWGLYGKDDELGTLNRLTDDVVLRAAREEIQMGIRYERTLCYRTVQCFPVWLVCIAKYIISTASHNGCIGAS